MADDKDTTQETPEEVTMKDLWQHISGMESRLRDEMSTRFDAVDARFNDQDQQLEAIRQVVDGDLARHPDLVRLENKVSDIAIDVRETKGRVSEIKGQVAKLQSRLDRAGIPS